MKGTFSPHNIFHHFFSSRVNDFENEHESLIKFVELCLFNIRCRRPKKKVVSKRVLSMRDEKGVENFI